MLKFEQVPPKTPEDVSFTEYALESLATTTSRYRTAMELSRVCDALGHVIVANAENDPELLEGIVNHLEYQLTSTRHGISVASVMIPIKHVVKNATTIETGVANV